MWELAIGAVAGVVVVLLVLIGSGILVRPSTATPTVTVTEVQWVLLQGTTRDGFGWFGPSYINVTDADGLPVTVASGWTLTLSVILANLDSSNHTISLVTPSPPFVVDHTTPALPSAVDSGEDDWDLGVTVTAPSVSVDSSYVLVLTLDAIA
ncbi:MAG TPA: hypothetical protein VN842_06710 [Thermoplasmata archaeon]|nr:hypothetical protein [Thermoplasmata archaeon]